jgi:DNA-binding XRE family transcriptional regulator
MREHRTVEQIFWDNIDKNGPVMYPHLGQCWNWIGSPWSKYGHISIRVGKKIAQFLVHRLSYKLHLGPIPEGLMVLHKCDNPICVNPDHLYAGTAQDNMDDKVPGERNPRAKLREADVAYIRTECKTRGSKARLAREFGVSKSTISSIANSQTWTSVETTAQGA